MLLHRAPEMSGHCGAPQKQWHGLGVTQGLTGLCVDLAEAVVAHLVHEAVEQHRGALAVHSELPGGGVVVVLLDVAPRVRAAPDPHHPQELVDVCKAESWGAKNEGLS